MNIDNMILEPTRIDPMQTKEISHKPFCEDEEEDKPIEEPVAAATIIPIFYFF